MEATFTQRSQSYSCNIRPNKRPKAVNLTEINIHSAYQLMTPLYDRLGKMDPLTTINIFNQQMRLVLHHILDKNLCKD
ncbi:unnamed protein product [Callosobruchus maculatus]|uniref:Uncharacterized protein n=1 Tax=Callosobruchus maculatus TaxID=64391 RepID=A0A653DSY7_CALMS|nr:unnamed protein product [Callosobruchus maculatus]